MKKIVLVLVVLVMIAAVGWSQESGQPRSSVSILLGGNLVAPLGVGVEFFLGNFGIVGELRGFFIGGGGELFGTVEPGAYGRLYFAELASSMFISGGVSYLTVWSTDGVADGGFLRPRVAVGYSALFGKDERTRFHMELGGTYNIMVAQGDYWLEDMPVLPYILLGFGRAF